MQEIDASPTKEFFISIITKDISLLDAVKDLVDNSVDGARALKEAGPYTGLWVRIELSAHGFSITDNCGGMSVQAAADYAFRFGRAPGAPNVEGSIGQFGVGMKRALFKMGRKFNVKSTAESSRFELNVDVEAWKKLFDEDGKEVWKMGFDSAVEGEENPEAERGTSISVSDLYHGVASEFSSQLFINNLIRGVQDAHARSMDAGLDIKINNFELRHRAATLLASDQISSFRAAHVYPADPARGIRSQVKLSIYAGVSDSDFEEAGWYIICNGRQIVTADKTSVTGWSTVAADLTTPKAHQQFARFRGYAVFESDDASSLPWNTSKSGVDTDSRVFQSAKQEMIAALRQVIDFLNALANEKDSESSFLQDSLDVAKPVELSRIPYSSAFKFPSKPTIYAPKTLKVQFDKSIEDVNFARDFFNVGSAKKADEAAFDYFLERERE